MATNRKAKAAADGGPDTVADYRFPVATRKSSPGQNRSRRPRSADSQTQHMTFINPPL
jgi:hypothetical protein